MTRYFIATAPTVVTAPLIHLAEGDGIAWSYDEDPVSDVPLQEITEEAYQRWVERNRNPE